MERNQTNLKQLIQDSGVSQTALAQKLGISRQHLHNILKLERKSKYSQSIFELLQQRETQALPSTVITDKTYKIESLPMLASDDLIRMYLGDASLTLLAKPFYAQYPFIHFGEGHNHFCLRLTDLFEDVGYVSLGSFRFQLSLPLPTGQIVLFYLPDSKKVIAGRIGTPLDTEEKFIVLAECTAVVHLLA